MDGVSLFLIKKGEKNQRFLSKKKFFLREKRIKEKELKSFDNKS